MGEVAEGDPAVLVGVISDQRTEYGIPHTVACRALGVSEAWFYKWRRRPAEPTKREVRWALLEERITHFFRASGDTYGSPRITLDLWAEGWQVSVNTVADIMADLGLQGRRPPRRRRSLTRQGKRRAAPDLVHRRFDAVAPDVLWVGDMTEIETGEGKLYLATVLDLFSRRLLGYAMGAHHDAALVGASLNMAAATRGGQVDGVIFHSDRGSEGGFNRSSQHLEHGGMRWHETRNRRCRRSLRERDGSGRRIGRCGRRCVHRVGRSRLVQCSAISGGGSRRE
ncbi:IS3 family transposase [Streptomyces sp900116325]|uniref:IS3 family transposase n=1 Tax=Streptomyces sp. 900116325 TaxID=3154295 RepID=UPI0033BAB312